MHSLARLQYRSARWLAPDIGSFRIANFTLGLNAVHKMEFPQAVPRFPLSE
jgi:hypothetical protein